MNNTTPEVHIYASARTFVVVPVVRTLDGSSVEGTPVHTIPLTLGRPTVVRLTRAIRHAREVSTSEPGVAMTPWDGECGRWWQHHLLSLHIKWDAAHVEWIEPELGKGASEHLAMDTPAGTLAERMIQRLGQKLHGD